MGILLDGVMPYDRFEVITENYAACEDFVWWFGKEEPSEAQKNLWQVHGVKVVFQSPFLPPMKTPYEALVRRKAA